MNEPFLKLTSSILFSSVWAEDDRTRIVWITLLALADREGYVNTSALGISRAANVPIEAVAAAIEKFAAPDPHSRSREHDGRRIKVVEGGGWIILNYARYRALHDDEARRDYERERKGQQRAKASECPPDVDPQVWEDWIAHRRAKRATVTQTVLEQFRKEAAKAGVTLEVALRESVARGWQGFRAAWWQRDNAGNTHQKDFDAVDYREGAGRDGRF